MPKSIKQIRTNHRGWTENISKQTQQNRQRSDRDHSDITWLHVGILTVLHICCDDIFLEDATKRIMENGRWFSGARYSQLKPQNKAKS